MDEVIIMKVAIVIIMGCCIFVVLYPGLVLKWLDKILKKGGKIRW